MKPLMDAEDAAVAAVEAELSAATLLLAQCVAELATASEPLIPILQAPQSQTGRRKTTRVDYVAMSGVAGNRARLEENEALQAAEVAVSKATAARKQAEAAVEAAEAAVAAQTVKRDKWRENAGPLTAQQFEDFGRAAVQPGYDYYKKIFCTSGGDMNHLKNAVRAATILDPFKLMYMSLLSAQLLVDDLKYFDFPEFTPAFLVLLKEELPLLLEHAQKDFDWSKVPGAAEYDAALKRSQSVKAARATRAAAERARAAAQETSTASSSSSLSASSSLSPPVVEEPLFGEILGDLPERTIEEPVSWLGDPAEKNRRIWEWWVTRVRGEASAFKHWPTALRLIALVQPSSADVERLFSQLKLIIQQIGESGLEEGIETRVMVRVNKLSEHLKET
jgi:hypothetical protein